MDKEGFRAMLRARKLGEQEIEHSIALAERFEGFAAASAGPAAATAQGFIRQLLAEGQNRVEHYYALARYGRFTGNDELFVANLELLDGAEAQGNLYHRAGAAFGEAIRDQAFAGIGLAPLGLPSTEKPAMMHPVVERLRQLVGDDACRELLADSLRDLPDAYFRGERRRYLRSRDVDDYLRRKRRGFLRELRKCHREGRLFFAQEITGEVLALVGSNPEIESGRREGNTVFVSKIPYQAKQWLAEPDSERRRYHYCHCPWAREGIRSGDVALSSLFCNCSAGFYKKPWQAALRRPVRVDVVESVLWGDDRCRFAIRLPEELAG